MKINEAINSLDSLVHNTYSQTDKIQWLSRLDSMVKRQVIDTHDGGEEFHFDGYNADTPPDTVLLAPAPFDEMYLRYMEAQIHYYNAEYERYNNAIMMFNTVFEAFSNDWARTHAPKTTGKRFLF